MRSRMEPEGSFFSTSHDSIENDSLNTSSDLPDCSFSNSSRPVTAPKSNTIEKMENNGTNSVSTLYLKNYFVRFIANSMS